MVCAVNGAWGNPYSNVNLGGIGGNIKSNLNSLVYVFSGVVSVANAEEAEIEAILHVLKICSSNFDASCRIAICSDATNAIESINGEADQLASIGVNRSNFYSYWTKHRSTSGPLSLCVWPISKYPELFK